MCCSVNVAAQERHQQWKPGAAVLPDQTILDVANCTPDGHRLPSRLRGLRQRGRGQTVHRAARSMASVSPTPVTMLASPARRRQLRLRRCSQTATRLTLGNARRHPSGWPSRSRAPASSSGASSQRAWASRAVRHCRPVARPTPAEGDRRRHPRTWPSSAPAAPGTRPPSPSSRTPSRRAAPWLFVCGWSVGAFIR